MKRIALLITIAVTMFTVSPTWALDQAGSPELDDFWARSPGCIGAPVSGAPFSAEAVTAWYPPANRAGGEMRVTARYFRDRAGRVRVDYLDGPSRARVMVIPDADRLPVYFLNTAARTSTKSSRMALGMNVSGDCFNFLLLPLAINRFVSFLAEPLDEELLGERAMEGVRVTGLRFKTKLPDGVIGMGLGERWESPDLKLVVYSRREDSHVGVVEYRLRKISHAEPLAQLFMVPADYAEVVGRCTVWENAYAPHIRGRRCDE